MKGTTAVWDFLWSDLTRFSPPPPLVICAPIVAGKDGEDCPYKNCPHFKEDGEGGCPCAGAFAGR